MRTSKKLRHSCCGQPRVPRLGRAGWHRTRRKTSRRRPFLEKPEDVAFLTSRTAEMWGEGRYPAGAAAPPGGSRRFLAAVCGVDALQSQAEPVLPSGGIVQGQEEAVTQN